MPKAAPVGEQVREHAERGDQRRLQRDEQEQEAEGEHDPDHERRLRGERLLEVVVLRRGAADERSRAGAFERSRSIVWPTAVLDGSALGMAWMSASPLPPDCAVRRRRCRDRARATVATAAALRLGGDDLECPGGADAERLLHLRVADPRRVVGGDDLDRGHAGLQPEHRQREQDEHDHGRRRP